MKVLAHQRRELGRDLAVHLRRISYVRQGKGLLLLASTMLYYAVKEERIRGTRFETEGARHLDHLSSTDRERLEDTGYCDAALLTSFA